MTSEKDEMIADAKDKAGQAQARAAGEALPNTSRPPPPQGEENPFSV
jgi:hypothetical protein